MKLGINKEFLKKNWVKLVKKPVSLTLTMVLVLNLASCSSEKIEVKNKTSHINTEQNITMQETEPVIRDISEDYEYLYVGSNDNITIEDGNFIKYKNTDNAFTRELSDFQDDKVHIDDASLEEYKEFLSQYEIEIPYSDLFNINHLMTRKQEETRNVHHEINFELTDGLIDSEKLYNIVKKNNSEYPMMGFYHLEDREIKQICETIAEVLNENLKSNKYIDIDSLLCNLGTLKILGEDNVTNARITFGNVLGVSQDMIKSLQNTVSQEYDAYKMTIAHEAEHLLQINCDHEIDKKIGNIIGFNQKWNDEPINSLFWPWYYEASAETLMTNHYDSENIVYENMTNYLKFLKLTLAIDESFKIDSLERVSTSRNSNDFYALWHANTTEEQSKIAQIMYAIELIQNENQDFGKIYLNYNNIDGSIISSKDWVTIKRELKVGISTYLSKIFYENLANYVRENDVTLNDIYYLITIYEAELESHIMYDSIDKFYINKIFMSEYMDMQNAFFRSITTEKNYTFEEIISGFNKYSLKNGNTLNLNENTSDFITDRSEELTEHITTNIGATYDILIKQYEQQKTLIFE